jgi:transcriptional regulator with XRE-family HTH domain
MEVTLNIEKNGLKAARRAIGLSQSKLGKLVGLAQVHISMVEQGRLTLLPHHIAAVETILGPIEWNQWHAKMRGGTDK